MHGILNLNKPRGMSSHDLVREIRRLLPGCKVGHAGTLDPGASGVLPVCVGKATRVVEYLMDLPKGYQAAVELGVTTDTGDAYGRVLERRPLPPLERRRVEALLQSFLGEQEQLPPLYSAIKYRGQPLYKWARKGREVPRRPRKIQIYEIVLLKLDPSGRPQLTFQVKCSRGTYVRTLVEDIGAALGCGAHLFSLVRLFVGSMTLLQSRTLPEVRKRAAAGKLGGLLEPMDRPLAHFPRLSVSDAELLALKQGRVLELELPPSWAAPRGGSLLRIYDRQGAFRALARGFQEGERWRLKTEKFLVM